MNKSVPVIAFATLILAGCTNTAMNKNQSTPGSSLGVMTTETIPKYKQVTVKDGTFQAEGSYTSPAGPENIGVKLIITKGLISDVSVDVKATNPKSKFMQTAFAGGIKEQVVGKKLADLDITKVAGSSLTSRGFNEALDKIAADM